MLPRGGRSDSLSSLRRGALGIAISALIVSDTVGRNADAASPQGAPPRHFVTNCNDNGPGSLRDTLASAADGDSVDLSQLTCSTITLTTGPLVSLLDNITISGNVTISGGGSNRVLSHLGVGTLQLFGLVFTDGAVRSDYVAAGGCVYSRGSIDALSTTVRNCTASSPLGVPGFVLGGGMFAVGSVSLTDAAVIGNSIVLSNTSDLGKGGGLNAGANLYMLRSTVSGNSVVGDVLPNIGINAAGGFYSGADVFVAYSTVNGNIAHFAGGGWFGYSGRLGYDSISMIVDSTISGNHAQRGAGGLVSQDALIEVWNSTIAFNTFDALRPGNGTPGCGGFFAFGNNEYVSFRSSIVANNTSNGVAGDVCATAYIAPIIGYGNLIIAADRSLPGDTLRVDPMLEPLANNGGRTLTHALSPGSPAIDTGNNSAALNYDQRDFGRVVGLRADIGAFEVQPDVIFVGDFD